VGDPAPELSETLTQHAAFIVHKFLTSTPKTFPPRPPSRRLGSNTRENLSKQLKETWRTRGQELTLALCSPESLFMQENKSGCFFFWRQCI